MAKRRGSQERDVQGILEVAILAARGLDQANIARALEISQGTVSRRLQEARSRGFIVDPLPQLRRRTIPKKAFKEAEDAILFNELRGKLVSQLNELAGEEQIRGISIVRTAKKLLDGEEWVERLRLVCLAAARELPELITRATNVGLAWGHTLRFLIDEFQPPGSMKKAPKIFPVVGSFPYTDSLYPLSLSSTRIASDFAEKLHGEIPEDQVSLASIPAFIPFGLERKPLMDFFSNLPGFREVFGAPGPRDPENHADSLLNSADMLITGVGDMPSSKGGSPSLRARLKYEKADLKEWYKLAVGDIGGVFIPRNGLKKAALAKVVEINRRFIGPGLENFQACARACTDSHGEKPGVLVIGHDGSKAETVLEAVRNGCVNHLLVDYDLAAELEEKLDSELSS